MQSPRRPRLESSVGGRFYRGDRFFVEGRQFIESGMRSVKDKLERRGHKFGEMGASAGEEADRAHTLSPLTSFLSLDMKAGGVVSEVRTGSSVQADRRSAIVRQKTDEVRRLFEIW